MSEYEILALFEDEVMNRDNFFYLELVLDWLKFNNMSRKCLREVWDSVNQRSLCWEYLVNVRIHFQNHVRDKTFELPLTRLPSSKYALRWYHTPLTKGRSNSELADLVKMKRLQVVMTPTSGILPDKQKQLYVSLEMFRRYPSYKIRASNGHDEVTMGRCWLELERTAAHCEYERVSMVTSTWDEVIHRLKTIDVLPWGYSMAPRLEDWYSSDVYLCGMVNNVPESENRPSKKKDQRVIGKLL